MSARIPRLNGIIFITGTDTGAGKTLLTAMLLAHLRAKGVKALAMKPFCSGGTEDLETLIAIQGNELSGRELNPYYFPAPLAPFAAAKTTRRKINLASTLSAIGTAKSKCDVLLVEGSGGLMVPLGKRFCVLDLIRSLRCPVVVAGRNQLGILNHVALTINAMQAAGIKEFKVALMGVQFYDVSASSNIRILRELFRKLAIEAVPYLPGGGSVAILAKKSLRNLKKTLARLLEFDSLRVRSLRVGSRQKTVDRKKLKKSVDGSSK